MDENDFTAVDSKKHELKAPTEYTLAQLFVMALIEVKKNTDKCNAYAKIMNLPQMPLPEVIFGIRGNTAGRAWTRKSGHKGPVIELNEGLMRMNTDDFIFDTIPHEVAHIAADFMYRFPKRHHGPEWQFVMGKILGCRPSTYHDYDVHAAKDCMNQVKSCGKRR